MATSSSPAPTSTSAGVNTSGVYTPVTPVATAANPNPINPNISANTTRSVNANSTSTSGPTSPAPTVITNADVIDKTIPDNTAKLATISNTGITVGADGVQRYANGTVVPNQTSNGTSATQTSPPTVPTVGGAQTTPTTQQTPTNFVDTGKEAIAGQSGTFKDSMGNTYVVDSNGYIVSGGGPSAQYNVGSNISQYPEVYQALTGTTIPTVSSGPTGDPATDAVMSQLTGLQSTLDSNTATQIQNIQTQFANLISQQNQINTAQQGSITQALLRGGSARYAPISSAGITASVLSYGVQQISDLQAKENSAIAAAQAAQESGDFKIVNDQLNVVEKVREEKQAVTEKMNETLATQANALKTTQLQSAHDTAITQLISAGITNPTELLNTLNASPGSDYTADEVNKVLTAVSPDGNLSKLSGAMGEYFSLVKAGIPLPASIAKLPTAQQPYAYVQYKAQLDKVAASKDFTFSTTQTDELLSSGLSLPHIQHIEAGIQSGSSLPEILAKETTLTQAQQLAITNALIPPASQSGGGWGDTATSTPSQ